MEREKARLMDEVSQRLEAVRAIEAKLTKLAEYEQIAAEFGYELSSAGPEADHKAPADTSSVRQPPHPEIDGTFFDGTFVEVPRFDGTFRSLVACYRTDERSPYHKLKHNVRENYDSTFSRIVADVGDELVSSWNAERARHLYDTKWAAGGKLAMGHHVMAKIRLLCTYGSVTLNNDACSRLSAILGNMRFKIAKVRHQHLTAEHVVMIRRKAHEMGLGSIALAQAFQFEIPDLWQSDVIGEWVPVTEPGESEIVRSASKWLSGLRWSEIDFDMVLHHAQTGGRPDERKTIVADLKQCPMIMEELNLIPPYRRVGPMVVSETTRNPWTGAEFRRKWRHIATESGVPKEVKNMDSGRKPKAPADPERVHAAQKSSVVDRILN